MRLKLIFWAEILIGIKVKFSQQGGKLHYGQLNGLHFYTQYSSNLFGVHIPNIRYLPI